MSTISTTTTDGRVPVTTKQKVGLVVAGLYGLTNIPGVLAGEPAPGEVGPPLAILVIGSVLGLICVVAAVLAWRGRAAALRVTAGTMILVTLTGLPALFVDVPMAVKALVGASVIITVVAVVLMLSSDRRPAPVQD